MSIQLPEWGSKTSHKILSYSEVIQGRQPGNAEEEDEDEDEEKK